MCTWQSITNILDGFFPVLFGLMFVAIFPLIIISLMADWEVERLTFGPRRRNRWARLFFPGRGDEWPSNQQLRMTRYAWLVPARRAFFVVGTIVVVYPLLSPTFCLNQRCAGRVNIVQPVLSCDKPA